MARKKIADSKGIETKKVEFKGFANLEIPSDMKRDCSNWIREDETVSLALEQFISTGHKVSVAWQEQNQSYQATAFCQDAASPNAGYILSAFAKHWYDALAVLVWKHYELANAGIWMPDKSVSEDIAFG